MKIVFHLYLATVLVYFGSISAGHASWVIGQQDATITFQKEVTLASGVRWIESQIFSEFGTPEISPDLRHSVLTGITEILSVFHPSLTDSHHSTLALTRLLGAYAQFEFRFKENKLDELNGDFEAEYNPEHTFGDVLDSDYEYHHAVHDFLGVLILHSKYLSDSPYSTERLARLNDWTKGELVEFERDYLNLVNYNVTITRPLFSRILKQFVGLAEGSFQGTHENGIWFELCDSAWYQLLVLCLK